MQPAPCLLVRNQSALPVEAEEKVANGLAVLAQSFGPTASPQSARLLEQEVVKVVSEQWA